MGGLGVLLSRPLVGAGIGQGLTDLGFRALADQGCGKNLESLHLESFVPVLFLPLSSFPLCSVDRACMPVPVFVLDVARVLCLSPDDVIWILRVLLLRRALCRCE